MTPNQVDPIRASWAVWTQAYSTLASVMIAAAEGEAVAA
jgi:hypothetical protein